MTAPIFPFTVKTKAPAEALDYTFPFGPNPYFSPYYLQTGETITSRTVAVAAGLNKDSDNISADGGSVIVWLSGGTLGQSYLVSCTIVTSLSRTAKRNMLVKIAER